VKTRQINYQRSRKKIAEEPTANTIVSVVGGIRENETELVKTITYECGRISAIIFILIILAIVGLAHLPGICDISFYDFI